MLSPQLSRETSRAEQQPGHGRFLLYPSHCHSTFTFLFNLATIGTFVDTSTRILSDESKDRNIAAAFRVTHWSVASNMAATVASSHPFGGGLHPLQAKGLLAAAQQRQQQQQTQSQPQLHPCMLSQHHSYQNDQRRNDPSQTQKNNDTSGGFEMATRKPRLSDFHRIRTLGTGTVPRLLPTRLTDCVANHL